MPESSDVPSMTMNGSFYSNNSLQFIDHLAENNKRHYRGTCMKHGFKTLVRHPHPIPGPAAGGRHLADQREGLAPLKNVEFLEHLGHIIGEAVYRFSIEEERARLASAVESTPEGVVITEPSSGLIQYVNPAFEQLTGYTKDELLGHKLHVLDSGKQDIQFYQGIRETIQRDGVWRGQMASKEERRICTMKSARYLR